MATHQYDLGANFHGYHIEVEGTPMSVWVENGDLGKGLTWTTMIDSVRTYEIGRGILGLNYTVAEVFYNSGGDEKITIESLRKYITDRNEEISSVSFKDTTKNTAIIWQRSLADDMQLEISLVGQFPAIDKIRAIIDASSPELLQVAGLDLMQEIATSLQ